MTNDIRPYLVSAKAFNEGICLLHASIHHQSNTHGQTAEDLLMLRLLGVANHVLNGLGRLWTQHNEAEGQACSFTCDIIRFCVKTVNIIWASYVWKSIYKLIWQQKKDKSSKSRKSTITHQWRHRPDTGWTSGGRKRPVWLSPKQPNQGRGLHHDGQSVSQMIMGK